MGRLGVYLGKNNLSIHFFQYIEYIDIFSSIYRIYRYITFDLPSLIVSKTGVLSGKYIIHQKHVSYIMFSRKLCSKFSLILFRIILRIYFWDYANISNFARNLLETFHKILFNLLAIFFFTFS